MSTLKLTIAYDGTRFAGWQRQKNARTIQAVLEEALQKITGQKVSVTGAGRTDSGVHAEGQAAHVRFNQRRALSPSRLLRGLNAVLPEDAVVRSIQSVSEKFHARYSAVSKRYLYQIWNRPIRPVFQRNQMLHEPLPLDLTAMRQAARILQGRHDFKAFHSSGRSVACTMRNLRRLHVRAQNGLIQIEAEADGFLYHMVRRIAGFLLEVGKGKHPPHAARQLLQGNRPLIAHTAPAHGLCLVKVRYL